MPATDDGSTPQVPIGFPVNFFGTPYSQLFVNNNGNVTFDSALSEFTPFNLLSTNRVIIAPFFADVDTRGTGTLQYGQDTVAGRAAFAATWTAVGYYEQNTDKKNTFQLVLVDRSDVGAGAFDFELNYSSLQWESGDASGGTNGLGGNSARAGYSNGVDRSLEFDGSDVDGALLDTNTTSGLIFNQRNSILPGRYRFEVRGGEVQRATRFFEYDSVFSQPTRVTDELGRKSLYQIDPANGNLLSGTQVVGQVDTPANGETNDVVTRFAYTPQGLIATMTDPNLHVTRYDYDARGRLITFTEAAGTADQGMVRLEYDAAGNITASVDENGRKTGQDPLSTYPRRLGRPRGRRVKPSPSRAAVLVTQDSSP